MLQHDAREGNLRGEPTLLLALKIDEGGDDEAHRAEDLAVDDRHLHRELIELAERPRVGVADAGRRGGVHLDDVPRRVRATGEGEHNANEGPVAEEALCSCRVEGHGADGSSSSSREGGWGSGIESKTYNVLFTSSSVYLNYRNVLNK